MKRFIFTLIFATAIDSAQGMEAPWKFGKVAVDECAARALNAIPNQDLIADWRREDFARNKLALDSINALLPEDQRLNAGQMERAVAQLMFGDVDEYLQAVEIYEDDMTDGVVIFPEYREAVRAWLLGLAERALPSREQIEAAKDSYERAVVQLNPIELMRRAKLEAKLNEVEARLGQPLFHDRDLQLDHSARTNYNTGNLMEDLNEIKGGARPYNIADYQMKMSKIRVYLRDYAQGIPYALYSHAFLLQVLDNETFRKELDFYASKEELYGERFLEHRVRGWILGLESVQENIEHYLKEELRNIYKVFVTGGPGPHYMGELYNYSLYWALQRVKPWEGMTQEQLEEVQKKIENAKISLEHKGAAVTEKGRAEIFSVEMQLEDETLYFALQARPKYAGNPSPSIFPLSEAPIELLQDLEIVEIRPLLRPARVQDGFNTYPLDLAEPLLKLDGSSVSGAVTAPPPRILISHLSLTEREKAEATPMETVREIAGQMGAVIFAGEKPMETGFIEIRFFTDELVETAGSRLRLPLKEERGGMQLYEAQQSTSFTRMTVTLKRNMVSGKYSLSIKRENGLFGFYFETGKMTADYRELRD